MDQGLTLKALPDLLAASDRRLDAVASPREEGEAEDFLAVLESAVGQDPAVSPESPVGGFGSLGSWKRNPQSPLSDLTISGGARSGDTDQSPKLDVLGRHFPEGLRSKTVAPEISDPVGADTGRTDFRKLDRQKPLPSPRREDFRDFSSVRKEARREIDAQIPEGLRSGPEATAVSDPMGVDEGRADFGKHDRQKPLPLPRREDVRDFSSIREEARHERDAQSIASSGVFQGTGGAVFAEPTAIRQQSKVVRHVVTGQPHMEETFREPGFVVADTETHVGDGKRAGLVSVDTVDRRRGYEAYHRNMGGASLPAKDIRPLSGRPDGVGANVRGLPRGYALPKASGYGALPSLKVSKVSAVSAPPEAAQPSPDALAPRVARGPVAPYVDVPVASEGIFGAAAASAGLARAERSGNPGPPASASGSVDVRFEGEVRSGDTIRRIVEYVEANRPSLSRGLDVVVEHDDLGRFGLRAVRERAGHIDVSVTARTSEAGRFFEDNRAELARALDSVGAKLVDVRQTGYGEPSAKPEFFPKPEFSSEGRDSEPTFSSSRDGRGEQEADSRRRRHLWQEYRERFEGGSGA